MAIVPSLKHFPAMSITNGYANWIESYLSHMSRQLYRRQYIFGFRSL